jgi:Protein of unknown function (DUF1761)
MINKINHLAVWILVIVHQLVRLGWDSAFSEVWLNLNAKTKTDIEPTHSFMPYLIAIVASIFVNYALAWLISRLNATSAVAGLKIAIVCWFAFLLVEFATVSAFSAFETNPWPLVFINMGRPFLAWSLSGLVLGVWQKRAPAVAGQ